MSTHNLCFEQKYEKDQRFLSENFQFFGVKFSIYLNRPVFVMDRKNQPLLALSVGTDQTVAARIHSSVRVVICTKSFACLSVSTQSAFYVNLYRAVIGPSG